MLGGLILLRFLDPVVPLAFLFWVQTVPITDAVLPLLARIFSPMKAAGIAVSIGAVSVAATWAFGVIAILTLPRFSNPRKARGY